MKIMKESLFKKMPDAVLFDIDNTLYAYHPAHEAAQNAIREKVTQTFSIKTEQFDTVFREARNQIKQDLGGTAASHSRLLYMQRMLEMMGLGSQILLALDFEQTYWRTFLTHAILFEQVKDLLDDLRLSGIPIAVVTDLTAQIQFRKMIYFGLDSYFDCIVTSEEAGFDKPHGAPFRLALKKLQLDNDATIWMIGDNPVNDIYGARENINAITLQKIHEGVSVRTDNNAPDATFKEFGELRRLISQLGDYL